MKTKHFLLAAVANTIVAFSLLTINVPLAFACTAAAGAGYVLAYMSWDGRLL